MKLQDQEQIQYLIGANILRLRMQAGISQQQLADSIGMHRSHFSAVERGLSNVCVSSLLACANGLGCGIQDLLKGVR